MSELEKLSDRQRAMLDFIQSCIDEESRPPTIREICEAVQISSTSVVNYNLTRLVEKGLIERTKEVSRGLKLTNKAMVMLGYITDAVQGMFKIPMAGTIVASQPVEVGHDNFAMYDEDDAVELSSSMLNVSKTDDLFALRVSGDSMIDAMVNDGDIVIMRQQTTARNGEMVAVWLTPSDTTTLKYFYNEGDRIRLQPANPHMEPIYVRPSDVRVQGKVMMVMRNTS